MVRVTSSTSHHRTEPQKARQAHPDATAAASVKRRSVPADCRYPRVYAAATPTSSTKSAKSGHRPAWKRLVERCRCERFRLSFPQSRSIRAAG
jgi:hypothetical protein